MEQPKFDEVEKYQASVSPKKHKNDKDGASITPTRKNIDTVDKGDKSRENVVKEANTSPISAKNKIDTVNKTEKYKTPKETVDNYKNNKTDIFNTIDKSSSTPGTNLSNRSFHIKTPQK